MSNKTILLCPCCGSTADVYKQGHREYGTTFSVVCRGCGLRTRPYDSEDEAIELWNLRKNGISMQELIEAKQYCGEDSDCSECPFYKEDDCYLNELQIGDNNNGWIPCSERMPKVETEVYIFAKRKYGNGDFKYITTTAMHEDGTVLEKDSIWHWVDIEAEWDEENKCYVIPEGWWECRHYNIDEVYNNIVDDEVIAWKPLPEQYKKEGVV